VGKILVILEISICYMVLDQVCNRVSGNIIRKRAIIQTTAMKEKKCA
jgi:hypothetical protein